MEIEMSWEVMNEETKPCPCGKGTVTYIFEMDDWNRTRSSSKIKCPTCEARAVELSRLSIEREQKRERLLAKAIKTAEARYLARWLALFENKSKKEAWLTYTGGNGYPALGTFYKHVKDEGVAQYLRRSFSHDFRRALKQMKIKDDDIETLLAAREKL